MLDVKREGEQPPVNLVECGADRIESVALDARNIDRHRHLEALAMVTHIELVARALLATRHTVGVQRVGCVFAKLQQYAPDFGRGRIRKSPNKRPRGLIDWACGSFAIRAEHAGIRW